MRISKSIVDHYHKELKSVIAKYGIDVFRLTPPKPSPYKTLRYCCGGPKDARIKGFNSIFKPKSLHKDLFECVDYSSHYSLSRRWIACNSLIGYMEAHVVILFFESLLEFEKWELESAEADFLRLTQPVNSEKLFVIQCAEHIPLNRFKSLVGSDNITTHLDIKSDYIIDLYGDKKAIEPYIDSTVLIPSGRFLYGLDETFQLPQDSRGLFVQNKYLVGEAPSVIDGAVFYKCSYEVENALNMNVRLFSESIIESPLLIGQSTVTRAFYSYIYSQIFGKEPPITSSMLRFGITNLYNMSTPFVGFKYEEVKNQIANYYSYAINSDSLGVGVRFPKASEWEYAARAFSSYKYSGSNIASEVAWFAENANSYRELMGNKSSSLPNFVGLLNPNAFGTYDMSGNVWEWCYDRDLQQTSEVQGSGYYAVKGGASDSSLENLNIGISESKTTAFPIVTVGVRLLKTFLNR